MKIVATIEARMGSTRLPGKVLVEIGPWRTLELLVARLSRSRLIDEIVLATTTDPRDAALERFAGDQGIKCFRGSEEDVLGRILGAARSVKGDLQVQVTGDCPLIDAAIVDEVIETVLKAEPRPDFASNEMERTFPIGLDCRVFPVAVLAEVDRVCKDPTHRVHGSTYIYAGPGRDRYRCVNLAAPRNLSYPHWRWTLDTREDLSFLRRIADKFGSRLPEVSAGELAAWLVEHPEVVALNSSVQQKKLEDG